MARLGGQLMVLPLHAITLDPELQPRAELDQGLVSEYAAALASGVTFPSVIVFEQAGSVYLLSDGYHRWYANAAVNSETIHADVRQGDWRSALVWSLSANARFGKPRQRADYHHAYRRAVSHNLVDPADTIGVAGLLRCGLKWAQELTGNPVSDRLATTGGHSQAQQDTTNAQLSLGARIVQRALETGLTRTRLVELIGVSRPTLNSWERGISWPSTQVLPALADALETSVDWLVNGAAKASPEGELLNLFRHLKPNQRDLALGILRLLGDTT